MIGVFVTNFRYKGEPFTLFNAYRDRVEADGGIVEAFSCAIAALRLPGVNVGQYIFDNYEARVLADGGVIEGEDCAVIAINNINKWELY